MANNCGYWMKIVAKDEATLDRFAQIMEYKDPEYYVYRVFEYEETYRAEEDGLFVATAYGEVAWGCSAWVTDIEDKSSRVTIGYEKKADGTEDYTKPIKGTAHYNNLPNICKELGIAIEIWAEEYAMCFQEHIIIARDGTYSFEKKTACYVDWGDEGSIEDVKENCKNVELDFETAYKGEYYLGGFEDFEECDTVLELWNKKELSLWMED